MVLGDPTRWFAKNQYVHPCEYIATQHLLEKFDYFNSAFTGVLRHSVLRVLFADRHADETSLIDFFEYCFQFSITRYELNAWIEHSFQFQDIGYLTDLVDLVFRELDQQLEGTDNELDYISQWPLPSETTDSI